MAHLSTAYIQQLKDDFGELTVLDDLIRARAADELQVPILAYPRFEHVVDDYEEFTGKELDRFIDQAVKHLMRSGIQPVLAPPLFFTLVKMIADLVSSVLERPLPF